MKILFVTELTHAGGVDTFLFSLLKNWPCADDDLHLVANMAHPGLAGLKNSLNGSASVESHDIPVFVDWTLARNAKNLNFLRFLSPLIRLYFAACSYLGFVRLFRRTCPGRVVIVAGGYPGGDSCRMAALAWSRVALGRPKALYNFHNLAVPVRWWQFVERGVDWMLSRSVSRFVAVSSACAKSMQVRPSIWRANKTTYVLNGIVPPALSASSDDVRQEFGFPANCPLVVMLATYEPRKGHAFLLDAFNEVLEKLPTARVIVCGYGYPDEVARVRQRCCELELSHAVVLAGFRKDAHRILAAADVLAVPTQSYESFGLVAAEAMSMGVPVVATNIGGLPEVVENDQGGYVVDPQNVSEFAARLAELLYNRELRAVQGRLGRKRYRHLFTVSRMAADYAELVHGQMSERL
jgi:glycosyltransferase involved in cell wall biosynthesis